MPSWLFLISTFQSGGANFDASSVQKKPPSREKQPTTYNNNIFLKHRKKRPSGSSTVSSAYDDRWMSTGICHSNGRYLTRAPSGGRYFLWATWNKKPSLKSHIIYVDTMVKSRRNLILPLLNHSLENPSKKSTNYQINWKNGILCVLLAFSPEATYSSNHAKISASSPFPTTMEESQLFHPISNSWNTFAHFSVW
jgi:hypothetical protein